MVPHLATALTAPMNELEQRILDSMPVVERWFRLEWMEHTPPFYTSVDVRNAGFKLAPVDTDLHPAAWNHLAPEVMPLAVQAAMAAIEKICPEARNLLLIPDNHTDDLFYLSSVAQLARILGMSGLNVRIGSLRADINETTPMTLPDGQVVLLEPLVRTPRRLGLKDFDPCTILLNHDLSAGVPGMLEDLHEQFLLPPLHAGWCMRRKSQHLRAYDELAKRFAKVLGMDPWLINPAFEVCESVTEPDALQSDMVRTQVDAILAKTRRRYKEYGIAEKPFVVIKADSGTHGAGLMMVRDAKEIDPRMWMANAMRTRRHMQAHWPCHVVLQEGVHTCERINAAVAEPVVYIMDRYVVGGFYRVHAERSGHESLNAPGSVYVPLAFDAFANLPQQGGTKQAQAPNRFYMYGVVARLAMLAASYEMEAHDPHFDPDL
jgi:glutamate--cysteine ligase